MWYQSVGYEVVLGIQSLIKDTSSRILFIGVSRNTYISESL